MARNRIKRRSLSLLCCSFLFSSVLIADEPISVDATSIDFEELLQTEYIPASHIANQISNAASAVSIVTAQDIKDYGYRTLGEILGSMRGIHTFEDYSYTYLAGRGYGSAGQYAGRIIVLIDGYRADDSMFGQAYIGNDALLDVSMIDRVEYIPGGNSAGYSNGALLGVINIITKKGSDIDALQAAYGYGSHDTHSRRVSFGKKLDNGADILLSVSDYNSDGRNFTYDDGTAEIMQRAQHGESNKRIFFKGSYDHVTLTSGWAKRKVGIPTYSYAEVWASEPVLNTDENGFVRLVIDSDLAQNLKLSASVWYGMYRFGFDDSASMAFMDSKMELKSTARWYGADAKFVGTWFDNHVISFGAEYRHDYQWNYSHIFTDTTTGDVWYAGNHHYPTRKTYSIYGYDEFAITSELGLNYGMRLEASDNDYGAISPQAALIWRPRETTQFKLSTGISTRQATASELETTTPEQVLTTELVWEEKFGYQSKGLLSFYRYSFSNRISRTPQPNITALGVEAEYEKHWESGVRLRTSYAYQDAYEGDDSLPLVNTPEHIAKFNLTTPINNERLRAGIEVQYLGSRPSDIDNRNEYAPSHTLTNLTLLSHEWIPNSDLTFKIRNVFNEHYGDVVNLQSNGDLLYPQDGRTFWIEWEYNFR